MKQISLAIIALLGWFALIAQLFIFINTSALPTGEVIIRYFSYFTIDTNIIVALCSATLLLHRGQTETSFIAKQSTLTAAVLYILVVGIVYNTVLRPIWDPQGLQKLVDELLHSIVPAAFLLYWVFFVPKDKLQWKHAFYWMIYPAIYGAFVLTRGYFAEPRFYPYPFIDISALGVSRGIINSALFTLIFFFGSFFFIWIGRILSKKQMIR